MLEGLLSLKKGEQLDFYQQQPKAEKANGQQKKQQNGNIKYVVMEDLGIKKVDQLKEEGNQNFKKGNYDQAYEMYTKALEIDPSNAIVWSNRAQTCLNQKNYYNAFLDSEEALKLKPQNDKFLFRKAQALKSMQIFDFALSLIDSSKGPQNKELQQLKESLETLKNQQEVQDHDLEEVYDKYYSEDPNEFSAIVDYVGPISIEIVNKQENKRGIVATNAIKQGDLILIERALEYLDENENQDVKLYWHFTDVSQIKQNEKVLLSAEKSALLHKLSKKIKQQKPVHLKVQQMFRGNQPSQKLRQCPSIELYRHRKEELSIIQNSELENLSEDDLINIVNYNSFEFQQQLNEEGECNSVGIYGLATFINHSCFANAIATPLKDLFILKASRNIDEGEEICIDYIYFTQKKNVTSLEDRKEILSSQWDFECRCQTCQYQIKNPKLVKKCLKLHENYVSFDDYKNLLIRMLKTVNENHIHLPNIWESVMKQFKNINNQSAKTKLQYFLEIDKQIQTILDIQNDNLYFTFHLNQLFAYMRIKLKLLNQLKTEYSLDEEIKKTLLTQYQIIQIQKGAAQYNYLLELQKDFRQEDIQYFKNIMDN